MIKKRDKFEIRDAPSFFAHRKAITMIALCDFDMEKAFERYMKGQYRAEYFPEWLVTNGYADEYVPEITYVLYSEGDGWNGKIKLEDRDG